MPEPRFSVFRRLFVNAGANVYSQVVNAIIQVVSLPLFLAYWGTERYGEWLLLTSFVAYVSASDMGFATVAANSMTMAVGNGDYSSALKTYQTTHVFLVAVSSMIIGCLFFFYAWTDIARAISLSQIDNSEAVAVVGMLVMGMCISMFSRVVNAGFRCDGLFAFGVAWLATSRLVEFSVQATLLVGFDGGPLHLAGGVLATRFVGLFVGCGLLHYRLPWLRLGVKGVCWNEFKSLLRPAAAFMLFPISNAITVQGTIQLISYLLGPAAVVVFAAHRTITNVAVQVFDCVNQTFWPELSRSLGAGNMSLSRALHRNACRLSVWLSIGMSISLAFFAPLILDVWTGGRVRALPLLFAVLLLGCITRAVWFTSSVVPTAMNRHDRFAWILLTTSTVALLILGIPLTYRIGLVGTGISLVSIDVVLAIVVVPIAIEIVDDSWSGFLISLRVPPFVGTLLSRQDG